MNTSQILSEVGLVLALRAAEHTPKVDPLAVLVEGAAHAAELLGAPGALHALVDARAVVRLDLGPVDLLGAVGAVDEQVLHLLVHLLLDVVQHVVLDVLDELVRKVRLEVAVLRRVSPSDKFDISGAPLRISRSK